MPAQLIYSTNTKGRGEIACSNRRFKNKCQCLTVESKADKARKKLEALFNISQYEKV